MDTPRGVWMDLLGLVGAAAAAVVAWLEMLRTGQVLEGRWRHLEAVAVGLGEGPIEKRRPAGFCICSVVAFGASCEVAEINTG